MAAACRRKRCVVLVSGSVAAVKVPRLCVSLSESGFDVALVLTDSASRFLKSAREYDAESYAAVCASRSVRAYGDEDEWASFSGPIGVARVLHVDLRRWADVACVCPATANTIAKAAAGICDNLAVSERYPDSRTLSHSPSRTRAFSRSSVCCGRGT